MNIINYDVKSSVTITRNIQETYTVGEYVKIFTQSGNYKGSIIEIGINSFTITLEPHVNKEIAFPNILDIIKLQGVYDENN